MASPPPSPPTVALYVLAQLCGQKATETEIFAALFMKKAWEELEDLKSMPYNVSQQRTHSFHASSAIKQCKILLKHDLQEEQLDFRFIFYLNKL